MVTVDSSENLVDIIANFSAGTGSATVGDFINTAKIDDSNVSKKSNVLIPNYSYTGSIVSNLKGSLGVKCGDIYPEYTNHGKVVVSASSNSKSNEIPTGGTLTVDLSNFNTSNVDTVSFDEFDLIDPTYTKYNTSVEFNLGDTSIIVSLLRAPSSDKIKKTEWFNQSIYTASKFWKYSYSTLATICEDSLFNQGDRIATIQVKKNGVVSEYLSSGGFKPLKLTTIGFDGRYANAADIANLLKTDTELSNVNGVYKNVLKYPFAEDNSVISVDNGISISIEYTKLQIVNSHYAQVRIQHGGDVLASDIIHLKVGNINDITTTISVNSKSKKYEFGIQRIAHKYIISNGYVDPIEDPVVHGKYAPPIIIPYIKRGSELTVISNYSEPVQILDTDSIEIHAISKYGNVDVSKSQMSINGNDFVKEYSVVIPAPVVDNSINVVAYIEGDAVYNRSDDATLNISFEMVLPSPIISMDSTNIGYLKIESPFLVLFSTDGNIPDLENRTNVAAYVNSFKLIDKTVIKAYAVNGSNKSCLVEFVFNPYEYSTDTNIPVISISGDMSGGVYSSKAVASISNIAGELFYTLDGSDPSNQYNQSRIQYSGPINILPIGIETVTLRTYSSEIGKRPVVLSRDIVFGFKCNPWRISELSLDTNKASELGSNSIKLKCGGVIERVTALKGNYYFSFDILGSSESAILAIGLKKYSMMANKEPYFGIRPLISILDVVDKIATVSIGNGDISNIVNKTRFTWNFNNPLKVLCVVKNNVTIADNVSEYDALSMSMIESNLSNYFDNMYGIEVDGQMNIAVKNIPDSERRLVNIPSTVTIGSSFRVTNVSNSIDSELIISSNVSGQLKLNNVDVTHVSIKGNESAIISESNGNWNVIIVDNLFDYTSTQTMYITVNGVSTDEIQVSDELLDNLMLFNIPVSNRNGYVEIGKLSGGCY
jgi:hypothetical protein